MNCTKLFFNDYLKQIDEWLGVCSSLESTPSFLRTSIAYNSPDVYLLLMYLAKNHVDKCTVQSPDEINADDIKALAFFLHWFGTDKKKAVMELYACCKDSISLINIKKGLSQSFHRGYTLHIYSDEEVKTWYTGQCDPQWNFTKLDNAPWIHFFNRTFWYGSAEAKEMLLYAQRKYINSHFSKYDPARQDLWADYNRPWDFDHITPQDWINNKRGSYREFDKIWLSSIGNIAAISFETNRGKGCKEDYNEYEKGENTPSLLFDRRSKEIDSDITTDPLKSALFAKITYNRYLMIYKQAYDLVQNIVEDVCLSELLERRKKLFDSIIQEINGAKAYFATDGGKEYEVIRRQDWARDWIGVGLVVGDYYACFEWEAIEEKGKRQNVEIGIRKAPDSIVTQTRREAISSLYLKLGEYTKENNNGWWYYWRDASVLSMKEILNELKKMVSLLKEMENN